MFGKGENLVATDYQMVRHPDIHQAQCLYQTFGDKPVCLTGCDFTGRVIVCQYHGSGIVVQGAFNHFPGMDFRAVDGAGEEGFTGNQLILVVQISGRTRRLMVPFCPFRFFTFRVAGTNFPVRVEVK